MERDWMAGEGASQNLQTKPFVDDGRRRRAAANVERTDLAGKRTKDPATDSTRPTITSAKDSGRCGCIIHLRQEEKFLH